MVRRTSRFNIYLLLLLLLLALAGCQSPETKREKQLATIRVHIEINAGLRGQGQSVSVLRTAPMELYIEKGPFLNENHVASSRVEETPGGFALVIQFDKKGQWLLEQYTAAHPNRRLAIRSQWGVPPDVQDRWLAAPLITGRIQDGVLSFTPDASRDEADQIVIGLDNHGGTSMLKDRNEPVEATGGKK